MTGGAQSGNEGAALAPYQRELVSRLRPLLERLDRARVTGDSGLRIHDSPGGCAVEVTVEAPGREVPGLYLSAGPDRCTLSFADAAVLECHRSPGAHEPLVNQVVELTTRYLSGTTVVKHCDRRGRLLRTEYFYGVDPQAVPGSRIGTSASPLAWICREKTTSRTSHRFLREEAAG